MEGVVESVSVCVMRLPSDLPRCSVASCCVVCMRVARAVSGLGLSVGRLPAVGHADIPINTTQHTVGDEARRRVGC
jgi:hypothetical protein